MHSSPLALRETHQQGQTPQPSSSLERNPVHAHTVQRGCSHAQASATLGRYSHKLQCHTLHHHQIRPQTEQSHIIPTLHLNYQTLSLSTENKAGPDGLPKQLPCFCFQNWLVLLYTILCYALTVEISRPVQRFAPKRYKYYSLQQSSSTLVLFIQNIYILGHVGCCHNPSPLLPVSRTVADHTSFTPCMVSNRIKTEGERAVLTDLGIPATGLQVLAHFSLQERI